jgi:hypothetical protein
MSFTTAQINYLNIALMIGSCALAFVFPFELFLVSYAVLGPLHYLTEISWLHDHSYFTEHRPDRRKHRPHRGWLFLVAVAMVALIAGLVAVEGVGARLSPKWEITFVYAVFVSALLVTEIKDRTARVISLVVACVLLGLLATSRFYVVAAFFLVTIIHVLIFTGAFILYGSLKHRSISGILSLLVFLLCVISFFVSVPAGHVPGEFVRASYRSFNGLNTELIKLLHLGPASTSADVYQSAGGLMIMRLIAFAYTYHYLNWFSKTSIIKWHQVPKARTVAIVLAWLGAVAFYAYDYDTGMLLFYFMSILHVMLEFPLNHRTFAEIGRQLQSLSGWKRPAQAWSEIR